MTDEYVTITNVLVDTHVDPLVTLTINLGDLDMILQALRRWDVHTIADRLEAQVHPAYIGTLDKFGNGWYKRSRP